jgi:hypothetical protein
MDPIPPNIGCITRCIPLKYSVSSPVLMMVFFTAADPAHTTLHEAG